MGQDKNWWFVWKGAFGGMTGKDQKEPALHSWGKGWSWWKRVCAQVLEQARQKLQFEELREGWWDFMWSGGLWCLSHVKVSAWINTKTNC